MVLNTLGKEIFAEFNILYSYVRIRTYIRFRADFAHWTLIFVRNTAIFSNFIRPKYFKGIGFNLSFINIVILLKRKD